MLDSYDAVVVGSGFGGAVAACRLAQAGLAVGVLERGRRYARGGFPRDWHDPLNGWVWQHGQGLFDVRPVNEVTVVQGAAYGGGSHLYANVHLRVPSDGFRTGWPAGYSRAALDPYYDLVAYMLDITPIREDQPLGLPPKTRLMREAADRLGRSAQFCYPNLAVSFKEPRQEHLNKFGVAQEGCRHCGECDIGCNYRAKNTLDLNYLAVAEQRGADVGTQCEVLRLDYDGDSYEIRYRDHVARQDRRVRAPAVFLCAGAVNSTELLLRCRDQYRSLPAVSNRLGHGYSANGDFLAFAMDTESPFEPWDGPTITTGIVYDRGAGEDRKWFIFQEGGFPREIAGLVQALGHRGGQAMDSARVWEDVAREIRELAEKRIASEGVVAADADSAVFLVMGRDRADGRVELMPVTHDLRVTWDVPGNLPLYDTEERFCADVAEALGGRLTLNPLWQRLRLPVAVHNLGGATMADDPAHGVVDGGGEVFGYPGLHVLDGAALPAATGVNPSHTIAAVAERNIEAAIRKLTSDPTWRAPERELATPVTDPVSALVIPTGGTAPPSSPAVGLRFTETMRGYVTRGTPAVGRLPRRRGRGPPCRYRGAVHVDHRHLVPRRLPHLRAAPGRGRGNGVRRGIHRPRRRRRQQRCVPPLQPRRRPGRPPDAVLAAVLRRRRPALPSRRVQGRTRPRHVRRLARHLHAVHGHPRGPPTRRRRARHRRSPHSRA
ncbi:GMC oxidoreductase [Pseudofrankia asymbiotica]|uniref:GMC oxidoreductase n=1 Tax=Pseudofrankia asymbiotica TaxID=1834516 RepID=UPI0018E94A47|nr:GMC family oxidoreductase [Pseudofrankia asymbiotica]